MTVCRKEDRIRIYIAVLPALSFRGDKACVTFLTLRLYRPGERKCVVRHLCVFVLLLCYFVDVVGVLTNVLWKDLCWRRM